MKTLTLLRHAKSDWSDGVQRDFDRPLNGRGERAARLMGQYARAQSLAFDRVLASPAVRVTETLAGFIAGYGADIDTQWDRRIYLASSATLLDLVRDLPERCAHVLMAGHNPGLEDLVLDLVPDDGTSPLRAEVEAKFPTASLASLSFETGWREAAPGGASLIRFTRPRDLDASLGPEES
jgi:phosphohistidine phosphatase